MEIVSQDDDKLVLAFATEDQLEHFEARLSSFAAGGHITHRRLLQDFDRWTADDRTGLALKQHGIPLDAAVRDRRGIVAFGLAE